MQPIAIGVDLLELDRIRRTLARHGERFTTRILAEPELDRLAALRDPTSFVAGRFAAKEAVLKVLGTGLSGGITWRDVVVVRLPSGAPRVRLQGVAWKRAAALGLGEILISISHDRQQTVAQALGLAGDPEGLRFRAGSDA